MQAACRWKVKERTAAGGQWQSGRTDLSLSLEEPAERTEFRKERRQRADRSKRLGAVRRGQKSLAHGQGGGGAGQLGGKARGRHSAGRGEHV